MKKKPDTIEKQQLSDEICKDCCDNDKNKSLYSKHKQGWDDELEFLAEFFVNVYLTQQKTEYE